MTVSMGGRRLDERHVRGRHLSRRARESQVNRTSSCRCGIASLVVLVALLTLTAPAAPAQQGRGAGPAPAAPSARTGAFLDLTGQWVSVITEDWRWRMVTPPKGDTASVPLNPAGRKMADAWDLAADRARGDMCKAFGPPGLIRQPTRIRIGWESDNTLSWSSTPASQTRRFQFGASAAPATRSLQGHSQARWFRQPQNRGIFGRGGPRRGRLARGRDHESHGRLPAPERRALQ